MGSRNNGRNRGRTVITCYALSNPQTAVKDLPLLEMPSDILERYRKELPKIRAYVSQAIERSGEVDPLIAAESLGYDVGTLALLMDCLCRENPTLKKRRCGEGIRYIEIRHLAIAKDPYSGLVSREVPPEKINESARDLNKL